MLFLVLLLSPFTQDLYAQEEPYFGLGSQEGLEDPYEKWNIHNFEKGKIPPGYRCEENTDCKPSPDRGHCYPGPPNNEIKYCQDGATHCALPGTSGIMYDNTTFYKNRFYECFQPPSGQARWRATDTN